MRLIPLILILCLGLSGCGDRPNNVMADSGSDPELEARWLQEIDMQLSNIESSYPATEYAKAKGIDLAHIRGRLDRHEVLVKANPTVEYLTDHNSDLVHAKEVLGNFEIAGIFWKGYFEIDYPREPQIMIHEMLRLVPRANGEARDNDGSESRELVRLMARTHVTPSPTILGRVQIGETCNAQKIFAELVNEGRTLLIHFDQLNGVSGIKNVLKKPITTHKTLCELRIPNIVAAASSTSLSYRSVGKAKFQGLISIRVGDKLFQYSSEFEPKQERTLHISESSDEISPTLSAIDSQTLVVRLETASTSTSRVQLEPRVLEIELN